MLYLRIPPEKPRLILYLSNGYQVIISERYNILIKFRLFVHKKCIFDEMHEIILHLEEEN